MKKISKKKKPRKEKQAEILAPMVPPQDEETEKKRFDFGGLPERDLKKNLGCG